MASEERLRELEEKYEGYTVYDNGGSKIGKVDDLFVDESDNEEYIGVKMGFFGSKSTLIPTEIVRVNEGDRTIEVAESKDRVKGAPSFSDDDEVTSEYEERIRSHFGLESLGSGSGRGSYGAQANEGSGSTAGSAGSVAAAGAASGTSDRDDRQYSEQDSSYSTGEPGSSGQDTRGETYGSSDAAATESTGTAGHQGSSEGSSSSSASQPTTTRQTEETETFQEGGRTKIRRRIIREEVVDADDQNTTS